MIPLPALDSNAEEPIYRQLYRHMREAIVSGQVARGEKIPPTRELAGQLGLNRTTVAAAYELLENDGLIRGHVGRGSFVEGGIPTAAGRVSWEDRLAPRNTVETVASPSSLRDGGISFASSRPSEDLFPLDEFRATAQEVLASRDLASILQLGSPGGYLPLRHYLEDSARREGVLRAGDDLLVTSGCQQALDLLQRTIAAAGDTVLMEDPVYPGLRNVFMRGGTRCVGVPVGPLGLDLETVARLATRERAQILVVTPNFQNPTGASMPLNARLALLKIAREMGLIVIENNIYGELRYGGEPLPSLKQLDESGDVIQLRSYSKVAFPGLRVGWILGPRAVIARLTEGKQWTDLHTDHLSQAVLLRFAESGRLRKHLDRMLEAGAERLRAALEGCERSLPAGTRHTRPDGGMSLWVRLPEPLDAGDLLARAEREGVTYLPGRYFSVSRHEPGTFRLSFAGVPPARITLGLSILGRVFEAELDRARLLRSSAPATAIV